MMALMKCPACEASDFDEVSTLKHRWRWCNECGSAFVELRRWCITGWLPLRAINRLAGGRVRFLIRDYLMGAGSAIYSKYADLLRTGKALDIWRGALAQQFSRLERFGIDWRGKRILILSGGPGIFAKALSEHADVTVTEFDPESVSAMREHLGLNVVRYDLNAHRLEDVVHGQFDLVIAESVVNFCADQRAFVRSLSKIVAPDGAVVITNDSPSLGYMLTWQFEDYIPHTFFHNQAFAALFYQQGFRLVGRDQNKYNSYWYRIRSGDWRNVVSYAFRTPFWLLYGALALMPWNNINRKWWSNNHYLALRFGRDR